MLKPDITNFSAFLLRKAKVMREDAAYGGQHNDGGAHALEQQVSIYQAGIRCTFPEEWTDYITEYNRKTDPEYDTYKRLKLKFEGIL